MTWVFALAIVSLAAYVSPNLLRVLAVRRLVRACADQGALVLTFDDGPSPEVTPGLLELLSRADAKATFFMSGRQVELYPELVDRVVAEGHEIGCHAKDHLHALRCSPRRTVADLESGYASLRAWVPGDAPYRPPYGKLNLFTWLRLLRRGAPICWWTVDSGDTATPIPDPDSAVDAVRRGPGGVILLHDLNRSAERNRFVLAATERLLAMAAREGLRVVPMGGLGARSTAVA